MLKGRKKKIKLQFDGATDRDDLVIGSHGNTDVKVRGTFSLSGIIYCPRNTVTLDILGDGKITFRGKCYRIIIKKIKGDCTLDLSDVTCRELQCESLKDRSVVIAGKTRVISPARLEDEAMLQIDEGQLIFNPVANGNARIVTSAGAVVESESDGPPGVPAHQ